MGLTWLKYYYTNELRVYLIATGGSTSGTGNGLSLGSGLFSADIDVHDLVLSCGVSGGCDTCSL